MQPFNNWPCSLFPFGSDVIAYSPTFEFCEWPSYNLHSKLFWIFWPSSATSNLKLIYSFFSLLLFLLFITLSSLIYSSFSYLLFLLLPKQFPTPAPEITNATKNFSAPLHKNLWKFQYSRDLLQFFKQVLHKLIKVG